MYEYIFLIIKMSMYLITYSFVKCGCMICIFLNSENLICRSTDISKCFRGSLQLRDNESRLYMNDNDLNKPCHEKRNLWAYLTYKAQNMKDDDKIYF